MFLPCKYSTILLRIISIISCLKALVACQPEHEQGAGYTSPEEFFESEKLLAGQKLGLPADSITYINYMATIGDSLLVLSDKNDRFNFALVDPTSGLLIRRFGRLGEGPGEIAFPTTIQLLPGARSCGFYVMTRWQYYEYSLNDILQGREQPYWQAGRFNVNYQRIYKLNDSAFIGVGLFKKRFVISNPQGDTIGQMGRYPFENKLSHSYNSLAMAYQGRFSMSPDGRHLCFATLYAPNVNFIHLDANRMVSSIDSLYSWPPLFKGSDGNVISADIDNNNLLGYLSVSTTNDRVYLLFSGKKLSDPEPYQSDVVLVFDWFGKPVTKYRLDRQLKTIAVDSRGETLYGFVDAQEPYVIKYRL